MITIFRWFTIKSKEIKYRLAFWKIIDQVFTELAKHPEEIEKQLTDSVIKLIIGSNTEDKND